MTNNPVADLVAVRQRIAQIISEDWADFVGVGPSELATADRILSALTPASAEPVAYQVAMSDGRWGTIFHHPDEPLGDHRPLYAHPPAPVTMPEWVTRCCQCSRLVDTREHDEGGDIHGCQMDDGRWTCSSECWEEAAGLSEAPVTVEAAATERELLQRAVDLIRGDLVGGEWKKACNEFVKDALRALSGEKS